jgi:Arc/MetJ-type ribon-helix-helix transcriptional regulator
VTIELPRAQSRTLSRLLKSGAFASPLDVVAAGLHLLDKAASRNQAHLGDLRKAVAAGAKQVQARRITPFDAAAAGRIKQRGRALLAAETPAQPPLPA